MDILKKLGWILVEVVAYCVVAAIIYFIIAAAFVQMNWADPDTSSDISNITNPYNEVMLDYLPLLAASIIGIWIVHQKIFRRSTAFSGWNSQRAVFDSVGGVILGFGIITSGFIILIISGQIGVSTINWNSFLFFGFMIFFLIQSSVEEFVVRSFLLPTIANRFNVATGLISTSLIFTLLHLSNPNVTALSLTNLFLAGILLGVTFLYFKNIYFPIGLHFGWNFFQGSFYGFEVSGLDVYSYIDSKEVGIDAISGGQFGLEGSVVATILMLMLIYWFYRKSPNLIKGHYLSSQSSNMT